MTSPADLRVPWDPGLQNERTALAWTRSTLALTAVGLLVARLAYPSSPILGSLLSGIALVGGGAGLVLCARRYRVAALRLWQDQPLPGGKLPAVTCVLITALGLVSLAVVATGAV